MTIGVFLGFLLGQNIHIEVYPLIFWLFAIWFVSSVVEARTDRRDVSDWRTRT
jgi:hypothetical protein